MSDLATWNSEDKNEKKRKCRDWLKAVESQSMPVSIQRWVTCMGWRFSGEKLLPARQSCLLFAGGFITASIEGAKYDVRRLALWHSAGYRGALQGGKNFARVVTALGRFCGP